MSRNGSGVYSLPQPAFVSGTKISSSAVNSDFSDVAAALTQSFSADGQTPFTGIFKNANGNSSNPSYTFNSDLTTGVYLAGVGDLGIAVAGTQIAAMTSSGITWTGNATWSGNASVAGTFGIGSNATVAGTFGVGGNVTVSGTFGVGGVVSFATVTATSALVVGSATVTGPTSASVQIGKAPTVQSFTSGSGTYTPTAGMVRIRTRQIAGGGGGAADVTNNGSAGNTTTFGSWTAAGGSAGTVNTAGGAGGSGGTNGTGTLVVRLPGGAGQGSNGIGTSNGFAGGQGGSGPFGGGGAGGFGNSVVGQGAGQAGGANTGGGGGGGGGLGTTHAGSIGGGGGGCGEYVEFWMTAAQVGASLSYTVGTGGSGGIGNANGGNGAAGQIIVEEFYV